MMATTLEESSGMLLDQAKKAALRRWKLETLTGLLGFQSLKHHQAENEKNLEAENRHIRKHVWGYEEPVEGDDMNGQTILGDNIHPTPLVINSPPQPQSSGLGKVLAGAALTAGKIGIPGAGVAGYLLSQALNKSPVPQVQPTEDKSLDIGLLRFEDLQPGK